MGQTSSSLTQYDVEELIHYCNGAFTQDEVEGLYRRFRALDRGRKGYISSDEFLAIPELSINPIAQRLMRMYESVNFKEFAKLLAPFSTRASRDDKLAAMFAVYDVDGDGVIGREDLGIMLRQLAGSSLTDEDAEALIDMALQEAKTIAAGPKGQGSGSAQTSPSKSSSAAAGGTGVDLLTFKSALEGIDLAHMVVEIPQG